MKSIATVAALLVAGQFAFARGEPPHAAGVEPPSNLGASRLAAANVEELKKRVEEGGFKDVEIVPQMFVVMAKKPDGRGVSMIVDAETLQALQLGGDGPDQGTDGDAAPDSACKGPSGGAPL